MLSFLMSDQSMSNLFTILNDLPIDKRRKFIQYQNIFTRDFLTDYTTKDTQDRAITWLRTQVPDDIQEPLKSFVVEVNKQGKLIAARSDSQNVATFIRKLHNTFSTVASDLSKLNTPYLGKAPEPAAPQVTTTASQKEISDEKYDEVMKIFDDRIKQAGDDKNKSDTFKKARQNFMSKYKRAS